MWAKRFSLIAMGVGAAVPLWVLGHSAAPGSVTTSSSGLQNGTYTQALATMQSTIAQLQAKNLLAEQSLQKLQVEALAWKNQNKKLVSLLQTAQTENLTLQNAVQKWQSVASRPQVHTVTRASGHGHDGGDGFGD